MEKQKKAEASKMNATSKRLLEQREKKKQEKQAIESGEIVEPILKTEPEETVEKEKEQPAKIGFGSTAKRTITHQKSPS